MANDYLSGAYEEIYKHPSWEKTARDYEVGFASKLYHAPFVKEAARTALMRFSSVFQSYYALKEKKDQLKDPQSAEATLAIKDVAEQVSGEKIKYSDVLGETLLPQRDSSNGAGQIANFKVESDDPENAKQTQFLLNKEDVEDTVNVDGNVREQMTMLYNASFINGGRNADQIAQSRSFKNMIVNITPEDVAQMKQVGEAAGNDELANLNIDFDVLREQGDRYKNKDDILDNQNVMKNYKTATDKKKGKSWFARQFDKVKRLAHAFFHRRKNKARGETIGSLGEDYYNQNNMPLSEREEFYGVDRKTEKLRWQEGKFWYNMDKPVLANGMLQTAGPSGTAMRMLTAYKMRRPFILPARADRVDGRKPRPFAL